MSVQFNNLNTSSESHSLDEYPNVRGSKESKEEVFEEIKSPHLQRYKSWNTTLKIKNRRGSLDDLAAKTSEQPSLLGRIRKYSNPLEFKDRKQVSDYIANLLISYDEDKQRSLLVLLDTVSKDFTTLYVLMRGFVSDERILKLIPLYKDFNEYGTLAPFKPAKEPFYLKVKLDQIVIPKKKSKQISSDSKNDLKREKEQLIKEAISRQKEIALNTYKKIKIDKKNLLKSLDQTDERKKKNLIQWKEEFYQEIERAFFHSSGPHQYRVEINGVFYPLADLSTVVAMTKEEYFSKLFKAIYLSFSENELPDFETEVKQFFKKEAFPLFKILQTLHFNNTAFGFNAFKEKYPLLFNSVPFNTQKAPSNSFAFFILDLNQFCMIRRIVFTTYIMDEKVMEFSLNLVQAYHGKKWHYTVVPTGINIFNHKYEIALKVAMKMKVPSRVNAHSKF